MADVKWHINGDYLLACNCDFGCPCNFNARPSMGFCQGAIGFLVNDGVYGDVKLDGQKAMVAVKWPGAIHEGMGVAAVYIDDGASKEQRDALTSIIWGQAGGMPFSILAGTWSRIIGPQFAKVNINVAGQASSVEVEGKMKFNFKSIKNPVTKAEVFPKVVLPQGFIFKEGDQYQLDEFWVSEGHELQFAHPGKCAEYAKINWQGP